MSRLEHERRAPRIQVDDLRRDLRHADQELYAFHTSERRRTARGGRVRKGTSRTVLVIGLTGGLATAVWAALPLHGGDVARTVHAPVHAVETAEPLTSAASDNVVRLTESVATEPQSGGPSIDRLHRAHTSPNAKSAPAPRASRTRAKPVAAASTPRRPRPLSPGEFGRFASSSE